MRVKSPNRLREIRERAGLSRADVASVLRVDGTTVARWELYGPINPRHVDALAAMLDVSRPYLMGWDEPVRAPAA